MGHFNMLQFNSISRKLILFWDIMKQLPSSLTQCVGPSVVLAEAVLMSSTEVPVRREENSGISMKFLFNQCLICLSISSENYENIYVKINVIWQKSNNHWTLPDLFYRVLIELAFVIVFYNLESTHIILFVHRREKHQVFCFCFALLLFLSYTKNHKITPPTCVSSLTSHFLFSCIKNILFYMSIYSSY